MPEIPIVIGGDTATADWANTVAARTAQRYATAAARDASLPGAVAGELAWLDDSETLTVKVFGGWATVAADGAELSTGFQSPGMIVASQFASPSNVVNGGLITTINIPGSLIPGTTSIMVNGTAGGVAFAGTVGLNMTGIGLFSQNGDPVSLQVGETGAVFRSVQVSQTGSGGSNTIQILSTSNPGQNTDYRIMAQAWINP